MFDTIGAGTILATLLGLAAVGIVWSSLAGTPFFGSDRVALVSLVIVGLGMCIASGVGNPAPTGPLAAMAGIAGVLSLLVLLVVMLGWTRVLDPFAGLVYSPTSPAVADRIGVLLAGMLIGIAWLAATVRQVTAALPAP